MEDTFNFELKIKKVAKHLKVRKWKGKNIWKVKSNLV